MFTEILWHLNKLTEMYFVYSQLFVISVLTIFDCFIEINSWILFTRNRIIQSFVFRYSVKKTLYMLSTIQQPKILLVNSV